MMDKIESRKNAKKLPLLLVRAARLLGLPGSRVPLALKEHGDCGQTNS